MSKMKRRHSLGPGALSGGAPSRGLSSGLQDTKKVFTYHPEQSLVKAPWGFERPTRGLWVKGKQLSTAGLSLGRINRKG